MHQLLDAICAVALIKYRVFILFYYFILLSLLICQIGSPNTSFSGIYLRQPAADTVSGVQFCPSCLQLDSHGSGILYPPYKTSPNFGNILLVWKLYLYTVIYIRIIKMTRIVLSIEENTRIIDSLDDNIYYHFYCSDIL